MPLSPDSTLAISKLSRRSIVLICAMIAVGFGLTLLVFYPGVMDLRRALCLSGHRQGLPRRLAIAGDDRVVVADRSDRAGRRQYVSADRDVLLAGFRPACVHCSTPFDLVRGCVAVAGTIAPGLCFHRYTLARCPVCEHVATGGRACFHCRRTRGQAARARPSAGAWPACARRVCFARMRLSLRQFLASISDGPRNFPGSARPSSLCRWGLGFLCWCRLCITARLARYASIRCTRSWSSTLAASATLPNRTNFRSPGPRRKMPCSPQDAIEPTEWDIYWRFDPCQFVMKRLESDKIFGTPALTDAWRARGGTPSRRLSSAPRFIHVEFSGGRRKPHNVGAEH